MEEPSSVIGIFGSIILLLVTFTLTNFVKPWADRKNRSEEQEEKPPAPVIGEPIMESAEDMWRRIHSESMQDLDDLRKKLAACQARCATYKMILQYHGLATLDDEDAGHTED